MSVLDRFEKSVEGAVNGVFSKFGSKDLQPVDLSSALEREIDNEAMPVGRDRTVAPNEYRFKLSTPDFDHIEQWGSETLADELADNLTNYARSQHYAFVGPVVVIFEEDLDLARIARCWRSMAASICSLRRRRFWVVAPAATSLSTTRAFPASIWKSTSRPTV